MSVKETSWQAYQEILRGGVATKQSEQVLQTINFYPDGVSRATIARAMGVAINSVCGRVNELLKADVIYVAGTGICPVSGKRVELLKVVSYE